MTSNRAFAAVLAVTLGVLAPGCAGTAWKRDVIYSASGVVLYREYQQQGTDRVAQGFRHPIDIPADKLSWLLRSLVYEKHTLFGKPENLMVFSAGEVRALAEPMSLALGAIGPNERLRFLVMRSNWKDVFLAPTGTSAVVFRGEDGPLNVAFDKVHDSVSGDDSGNPRSIVFRIEPTKYEDAYPLVPAAGTRLHVDAASGKVFPRWLEVRPDELELPPLAVSGPTAASASPAGTAPVEPPLAGKAPDAKADTPPAPAGVDDERYRQVRERIAILQRLRAEGTITDAQYKEALNRILVGTPEEAPK